MPLYFSARAAARIAHVSSTKLQFWHRKNLLRASLRAQRGRGGSRFYSLLDVLIIAVAAELSDMGISIRRRQPLLACIRDKVTDVSEISTQAVLISDLDQRCEIIEDPEMAVRLLAEMDRAVKVPVGALASRVQRAAAKLRGEGLTIVVPP